ncbi:MAG: hypothetical protein H7296_11530 [Bacteroidia bacterium]|nr:hypothetical protein [Bacteroidia bacterium]
MKIFTTGIFIVLYNIVFCFSAMAQDTMIISGTHYIKKGQTLSIAEGKLLLFKPGATLQVEGSLKLTGSAMHPITVKSADPERPGIGILFSGITEDGLINITNVKFESLLQPLHFDPFWYRKEVNISFCSFSGSQSGEPVLYVSKPLLDIRGNKDILFNLKDIRTYNNSGNFLLEAVGADGIIYLLDNLLFFENNIEGGNANLGILHLDCSTPVNPDKIKIGKLGFVRNFAGNNAVGLSVGGSLDNLNVSGFYQDLNEKRLIYDRQVNNRIPKVDVGTTMDIAEWQSEKNIVKAVTHNTGVINLKITGDPKVKELQDSLKFPVNGALVHRADSIFINYADGKPMYIIMSDGYIVNIPTLLVKDSDIVTNPKRITLLTNQVWPDTSEITDSTLISLRFRIPTFGGKNKVLTKLKFWEIGGWFGGGIYWGGDYKHRFGPFFPSTIEYSGGIYGQYNVNDRFSIKTSFYLTTISMHNSWAPGQFARMAKVFSIDRNYQPIEVGRSYEHMFATKMQILEFEGLWHIRSYMLTGNQKAKLVPTIGFGAGVFHFTPYRYAWSPRLPNETFGDWKDRIYTNNRVNLRELGTEGQNFLPGAKQYSSIAFSISSSFSLTLLFKKWAIKGEAKAVVTSTDYLDDYGPGLWYGGDYNKMLLSAKNNTSYSDGLLTKTLTYDPNIASNAPRSTNGLTDGYFQFHFGISYFLNRKKH